MVPSFPSTVRIGHGFDLHRLEPLEPAGSGKPLVLGGVRVPSDRGPVAHSDGDALLHAITDAILGAVGLPDIGELFPDTDPKWAGANSAQFLQAAVQRATSPTLQIANVDATIILERPKLAPYKAEMKRTIAELLRIPVANVNVKGKTHEGVDAIGRGEAVAVHAVVLLYKAGTRDT